MTKRKNYDSGFCGSVPLHNINLIQPHGYLLVLDKSSFNIIQVSENITDVFNKPVTEVVNTSFEMHAAPQEAELLKSKFDTEIKDKMPFTLTLSGQKMQAMVHLKDSYLIIELEKANENQERYFTQAYQEIKYAMAAIEQAGSVVEASRVAVHELKKLSGFDGIMMYRFDDDWNGTVIAEEKEPGMEEYMGFTFPASDIPRQARQMYLKSPYRLIPNRSYTPVRLYPVINPATQAFIDLSDCNLRSVAAVHIEYLKNMKVEASMSVRVINNGKLWGLLACHHRTPLYLNFEQCSMFELLSSVVSNKISSILHKEEFDFKNNLQQKKANVIEQIYADNDLVTGLLKTNGTSVADIFNAAGAVVSLNGRTEHAGNVPDNDSIENILLWLQGKSITAIFSTDSLSEIYDDAVGYADIASGMLAIPIDSENGDYVICFRPEVLKTIKWGGNPDEAVTFDSDGKNYHPRYSFKLWQQKVSKTSLPWHQHELDAAEALRSFIYEFKTRQMHS